MVVLVVTSVGRAAAAALAAAGCALMSMADGLAPARAETVTVQAAAIGAAAMLAAAVEGPPWEVD